MAGTVNSPLIHWSRVTHACVGNLTTIGLDNDLSPGRHQAVIWTNAGILLIGPLETNFSEVVIEIHIFSFKKMNLKMSGKWRPSWLGLSVLVWGISCPLIGYTQIARFMGPTWGQTGSCRPQMGPTWTLLSEVLCAALRDTVWWDLRPPQTQWRPKIKVYIYIYMYMGLAPQI